VGVAAVGVRAEANFRKPRSTPCSSRDTRIAEGRVPDVLIVQGVVECLEVFFEGSLRPEQRAQLRQIVPV
jgi:hypothetical protein